MAVFLRLGTKFNLLGKNQLQIHSSCKNIHMEGVIVEEKLAVWVYEQSLAKQNYSDYEKARIIYGWTVLFYNLLKVTIIPLLLVY